MVELTNRQNGILIWLCCQNNFISVKKLASHFGVSARSIRNDLVLIEAFASEYGVKLGHHKGSGVGICDGYKNRIKLLSLLDSLAPLVLTRKERQLLEVLVLLASQSNTYQRLADVCRVSRQTVINDFPETEGYLKNNSISVERVQGAGIYITGSEENIRHAFIQVLADSECSIAVLTRLNEVSFIIIIF